MISVQNEPRCRSMSLARYANSSGSQTQLLFPSDKFVFHWINEDICVLSWLLFEIGQHIKQAASSVHHITINVTKWQCWRWEERHIQIYLYVCVCFLWWYYNSNSLNDATSWANTQQQYTCGKNQWHLIKGLIWVHRQQLAFNLCHLGF